MSWQGFLSRTDVQTVLICRTQPRFAISGGVLPSLPLGNDDSPKETGVHCSGSVHSKALTRKEEAKFQITSQTQLQPPQKQNAG